MKRLYLLDASIYIFPAWFSMPDRWHSPQGYPLNAVVGYLSFLLDLLEAVDAEDAGIVAAFDESLGSCFRNRIYPDYKSSRTLPDEALAFQLQACRELTELLGISCYGGERYEADDYLATLAAMAREQELAVCVVSRDKDLGQLLLAECDSWWDYAAQSRLDRVGFFERFAVWPEQFPDYQGLVGDPVDDIPGVPGVGAKSAARMLQSWPNLEELYQNLELLTEVGLRGAARLQESLAVHRDVAFMSRELARLADHIELGPLPDPVYRDADHYRALINYLDEIDLQGALRRRCLKLYEAAGG